MEFLRQWGSSSLGTQEKKGDRARKASNSMVRCWEILRRKMRSKKF